MSRPRRAAGEPSPRTALERIRAGVAAGLAAARAAHAAAEAARQAADDEDGAR